MRKVIQEEVLRMKKIMGLIVETQSSQMVLQNVNKDMIEMGEEPLEMEEMEDLLSCPEEDPQDVSPDQKNLLTKIKDAIQRTNDKEVLKNTFKQIKDLLKRKKQRNEQVETMMIMGVTAPVAALLIIGGLVLINILIKLIRNAGGGVEYIPSCRQGAKAVKERRGY